MNAYGKLRILGISKHLNLPYLQAVVTPLKEPMAPFLLLCPATPNLFYDTARRTLEFLMLSLAAPWLPVLLVNLN